MKILFLSAASSIHTVKWVNALAERGHEVFLVYNKGHEPKGNGMNKNIILIGLKHKGSLGYYLNARELSRLTKKINPDVINVHYASGYGTLARCANLDNYILSIWGSDVYDFPLESKIKNIILKKNVKSATHLASTSNCMAKQLKKVMNDEKLDITITPFGVDLKLFDIEKFEQAEKNEIVIGNIKALENKYGIRELILAFEELKKNMKKDEKFDKTLKLLVYGDGSQKNAIEQLIKEKGMDDSIKLMGRIPNKEVPKALHEFDIFCALSQLDSESFGVAAVEAMAMEKPVVVSDVDGFKEVTVDTETGFVVPKKDVKLVAEKLKELIVDKNLRAQMGKNGRKRVETLYNWEDNVTAMEKLYYSTMK